MTTTEKLAFRNATIEIGVAEPLVTSEERALLLDRRFAFIGDLERTVWTEAERTARLQLTQEENA